MSIRTERVARLLQRELAEIFAKEIDRDPLVTLTHIRVTRDLSIAHAYISILAPTPAKDADTFSLIEKQLPRLRAALGKRLRHQLRAVPELRLVYDDSRQEGEKIELLLARAGVTAAD